jgi:uncharacterized membrane protein YiaA
MPDSGRATSNHVRALCWATVVISIGGVLVGLWNHDWALTLAWIVSVLGWTQAARSVR